MLVRKLSLPRVPSVFSSTLPPLLGVPSAYYLKGQGQELHGVPTLWLNPTGFGALAVGINITLTRATGTFVGPGEPLYLAYLPQHLLCE